MTDIPMRGGSAGASGGAPFDAVSVSSATAPN
jgi:hypothetical protein